MKKLFAIIFCLAVSALVLCSCSFDLPFFNDGGASGDNSTTTPPDECTVSFETNAGYPLSPITVKYNSTLKAPSEPSKKGARFVAWYLGDVKWDFTYDKVVEDMTLTAKWQLVDYTITYDLGGGSYDGAMPESYTVESPTLTLGTPSREDYVFLGWTINGAEASEITMGSTGNKEIKAKWFGLEAEVLPVKDGAKAIVTIIHDDARLPTMELLDAILQKYDMVADVGFLLNKVYDGYTVNTSALNSYKSYIENGRWKIVNHSATHNWWGTEVTNEFGISIPTDDAYLMKYELETSALKMRELFPGQRVLTFAYPGFSAVTNKYTDGSTAQLKQIIYTPAARRLIDTHHIGARYYGNGANVIGKGKIDWNWISSRFLSTSSIHDSLDSILEAAVKNCYFEVLSIHGLTSDIKEHESDPGYYLMSDDMDLAMSKVNKYVDEGKIWNANFEDAVLYLREAETATATVKKEGTSIVLTLTDEMDDEIYDAPLTVRLTNFGDADIYRVVNGGKTSFVNAKTVDGIKVLDINVVPDGDPVVITPATTS